MLPRVCANIGGRIGAFQRVWSAHRCLLPLHSHKRCLSGPSSSGLILGIESSFDDTGVAILDPSGNVLADIVVSQREQHLSTGGTVPSLAGKLHRETLPHALDDALQQANCKLEDIRTVGFTRGPGLAPCLHAGLDFVRELKPKMAADTVFIPVHHMEAHALTPRMEAQIEFPFLVLLASGAHCMLLVAKGVGDLKRLGTCLDDSPGEAFDKVARHFGLQGGGPELAKLADGGKDTFGLTIPLSSSRDCNFSFAGLKTAVLRVADELENKGQTDRRADLAASFQETVCKHIMVRTNRAIEFCRQHLHTDVSSLVVSGGVACNQALRRTLNSLCGMHNMTAVFPPMRLCLDNGVMIAWTALEYVRAGGASNVACSDLDNLLYMPKWPLGEDISQHVAHADIRAERPSRLLQRMTSRPSDH